MQVHTFSLYKNKEVFQLGGGCIYGRNIPYTIGYLSTLGILNKDK